jgi:alkyl sulfatase BDS1-like metallo-beta-lactamase superfamily hydrolase
MKLGLATAATCALPRIATAQGAASGMAGAAGIPEGFPARYMGGPVELATAPNGAVIYDRVLEAMPRIVYAEPVVEEVTEGLWVIGGHSIANCVVIDAPDGLIVYDTGDWSGEGSHFRAVIEQQISKRLIKAIIYSHSHYALGGGAMVDDPASVIVNGRPKLNETVTRNLQGGGTPSAIPELGPVLTARGAVQFSNFLPEDGPDASLSVKLQVKTPAFLPVTVPVEDGQALNIAGLELQFFTEFVSDHHSVTVWIPSKRAVLNNFFWPGTPNLYSLRGAVYRDPQVWRDGLRVIRDLKPEHLLSTHARAISGEAEVRDALTTHMDLISLTFDQTLRGILRGLGPDDLRYFIYKPAHLAEAPNNAEIYGETTWFPPAVFYHQMGWYDRDTTGIYRLPPAQESERLVRLMGGRDAVITAARAALDEREYAWAAQLVNHVYLIDPQDEEARRLKAEALRKLGQQSFGSIGRAFLLSEAPALEGVESIPTLVPPRPEVIAADPATFVNYRRVRIDPRKAEMTDRLLAFDFGTRTVGLHVRRGVVEYVGDLSTYDRDADFVLQLDGAAWSRLYLNTSDLASEARSGSVSIMKGSVEEVAAVFDLFDLFSPARNVTIPQFHTGD